MDVDPRINLSLSDYLYQQYPDGVYLKEQLEIYTNARRRLNERFVEIKRSGGSLTQLGLGKEETPYPGIAVTLENIKPIDWWALVHGDRIFSEAVGAYVSKEKKEVIFDMDEALSVWWKYAADYKRETEKTELSYKDISRSLHISENNVKI